MLHAPMFEAMEDETRWSAGKQLAMAALRDGVDVTDVEAVRAHALGRGLDARFVDEFLPPPPMSLGDGRFAYWREGE